MFCLALSARTSWQQTKSPHPCTGDLARAVEGEARALVEAALSAACACLRQNSGAHAALAAALEEAERLEGANLAQCLAGVSAPAELRAFVLGPGAADDGLGIRALPSGAAQHRGDLGGGESGEPKSLAGVPSCGTPTGEGVGDAGLLDGGSLGDGIDGLGSGAAGALAR